MGSLPLRTDLQGRRKVTLIDEDFSRPTNSPSLLSVLSPLFFSLSLFPSYMGIKGTNPVPKSVSCLERTRGDSWKLLRTPWGPELPENPTTLSVLVLVVVFLTRTGFVLS